MPKLKKATAKRKAKKLIKDYANAGFNETELARREGVSQPAIHQRLNRSFVQQSINEILEDSGLTDNALVKVLKDGLKAKRGKTKDHYARHKFLCTILEMKGHIKKSAAAVEINVADNRKFQHFEFKGKSGDEIAEFLTPLLKNRIKT